MDIALLHDHFDESKLEAVKKYMIKMGAPKIHAVWMDSWALWAALEGCHRLRAAKDLGITPVIVEVEYSEDDTLGQYGCDDSGDGNSVAWVCDQACNAEIISF